MGGADWASCFQDGFPLIGAINYPGVFPLQDELPPLPTADFLATAPARWNELTELLPLDDPDSAEIWKSLMDDCSRGWLEAPALVDLSDPPSGAPARRFLVRQPDKTRPVDNLKNRALTQRPAYRAQSSFRPWAISWLAFYAFMMARAPRPAYLKGITQMPIGS